MSIESQTYPAPSLEELNRITAIHRLRVNVKSLAAEARIIRQEEARCGKVYRRDLGRHRRGRLREEARHAQLALAYVRGRPYRSVEPKCWTPPSATRLFDKLTRLSVPTSMTKVAEWLDA